MEVRSVFVKLSIQQLSQASPHLIKIHTKSINLLQWNSIGSRDITLPSKGIKRLDKKFNTPELLIINCICILHKECLFFSRKVINYMKQECWTSAITSWHTKEAASQPFVEDILIDWQLYKVETCTQACRHAHTQRHGCTHTQRIITF